MEFKVLKESARFDEKGAMPSTIVLEELTKGGHVEYVTHLKVYPERVAPKIKPYTVYGNYFTTLKAAEKDYKERCERYGVAA